MNIATICQLMRRVGVAAVVAAMLTMTPTTWASSTESSRTFFRIHQFQRAARIYHQNNDKYPVTDEDGTWYKKLVTGNYLSLHEGETTSDGSLPVDSRGHLFIYELPFGADAPLSERSMPILRWVGMNGRDDQGKGDDIDLRHGVNYGYYYKAGYPYALGTHVLGLLLTIALWRRFARADIVWILQLSILLLWVSTWAFTGGIIGSHGGYEDVAEVGAMGVLLGLAGCFATGIGTWVRRERRANLRRANLCVDCKYDLRGTESPICPECGHDRIDG